MMRDKITKDEDQPSAQSTSPRSRSEKSSDVSSLQQQSESTILVDVEVEGSFESASFRRTVTREPIPFRLPQEIKVYNARLSNSFFVPRVQLQQQLYHVFDGDRSAQSSGIGLCSVVLSAFHGLSGVGKTQLAVHYFNETRKTYGFKAWFQADNEETLQREYVSLAYEAGLIEADRNPEEMKPEIIVRRVKDWLSKNPGWLLVYDNAANQGMIEKFLPSQGGDVLITSKSDTWIGQHIFVSVMEREEAIALVKKIYEPIDNSEDADIITLVETLGRLPLAIAQAAAYIKAQHLTVAAYLALYDAKRMEMLSDDTLRNLWSKKEHEPVALTWLLSIEALRREIPDAEILLQYCAYFSNRDIPHYLLRACLYESNTMENQKGKEKQAEETVERRYPKQVFWRLLRAVKEYSLLEVDNQQETVSIHQLVQTVIQEELSQQTLENLVVKSINAIKVEYPEKEPTMADVKRRKNLIPHMDSIYQCNEKALTHMDEKKRGILQLRLLLNLADVHGDLSDVLRQKSLLERALSIQESHYGESHWCVATTLNNLATTYGALGDVLTKKTMLERALTIQHTHYGDAHLQITGTMINLANVYGALGNASTQKLQLERALSIQETHYGKSSWQVAITLENLANATGDVGDIGAKKKLLERTLAIKETHYGKMHWQVAGTLVNLANAYGALGDALRQKAMLERALAIQVEYYGKEHWQVAITLVNLAIAYGALGDAETKKSLCEYALVRQEKHYGKAHWQVAGTLVNLANAYGALGDPLTQKALLERALAIEEGHFGKTHWRVASTLTNLATAYSTLGDAARQKSLCERALAIEEAYYGKTDWHVTTTLVNLANAYGDLGDAVRKKELLERALVIQRGHFGEMHLNVGITLLNLANAYGDLDDAAKQKILLEDSLKIFKQSYGEEHGQVGVVLYNLAIAHYQLNDLSIAYQICLQAKKILMNAKGFGAEHPSTKTVIETTEMLEKIVLQIQRRSENPMKTQAQDSKEKKELSAQTGMERQCQASSDFKTRIAEGTELIDDKIKLGSITEIECRRIVPEKNSGYTVFYIGGTASVAHFYNATSAECSHIAKAFSSTVITIFHRTSQMAKFPIPLNDCSQVINYYLENHEKYGINPMKVAIGGYSAGGLLATQICMINNRNEGIPFCQLILLGPITSLSEKESRNYAVDVSVIDKDFFERMVRDYVPVGIDPKTPMMTPNANTVEVFSDFLPTVILYGENESFTLDTGRFIDLLKESQVKCTVKALSGKNHFFTWGEDMSHLEEIKEDVRKNFEAPAISDFNYNPGAKLKIFKYPEAIAYGLPLPVQCSHGKKSRFTTLHEELKTQSSILSDRIEEVGFYFHHAYPHYEIRWWFIASDAEMIQAQYKKIAVSLGLVDKGSKSKGCREKLIQWARGQNISDKMLIVYEGAINREALSEVSLGMGHTITVSIRKGLLKEEDKSDLNTILDNLYEGAPSAAKLLTCMGYMLYHYLPEELLFEIIKLLPETKSKEGLLELLSQHDKYFYRANDYRKRKAVYRVNPLLQEYIRLWHPINTSLKDYQAECITTLIYFYCSSKKDLKKKPYMRAQMRCLNDILVEMAMKGQACVSESQIEKLKTLLKDKKKGKQALSYPNPFDQSQYEKVKTSKRLTNFQLKKSVIDFIKRPKIFEELKGVMEQANKPTVLNGLAGIGKTQLAAYYCQETSHHYRFTAWFDAKDKNRLQSQFYSLAINQKIITPDEQLSNEGIQKRVKRWFDEDAEPWLIVFDDATDYNTIKDFIPEKRGKVLITSYSSHWLHANIITLNVMEENEAMDLMQAIMELSQESEYEAMKHLAAKVGYLPLALAQAAAYIKRKSIRVEDYLQEYETKRSKLLSDDSLKKYDNDEHVSVITTIKLNLEAVENESLDAIDFLRYVGLLNSSKISVRILDKLITKAKRLAAIEVISRYSLLQVSREDQTFSMHQLIQDIVQDETSAKQKEFFLNHLAKVLIMLYQKDAQAFDAIICNISLVPHMIRVKEHKETSKQESCEIFDDCIRDSAAARLSTGDYETAIDLLYQMLESFGIFVTPEIITIFFEEKTKDYKYRGCYFTDSNENKIAFLRDVLFENRDLSYNPDKHAYLERKSFSRWLKDDPSVDLYLSKEHLTILSEIFENLGMAYYLWHYNHADDLNIAKACLVLGVRFLTLGLYIDEVRDQTNAAAIKLMKLSIIVGKQGNRELQEEYLYKAFSMKEFFHGIKVSYDARNSEEELLKRCEELYTRARNNPIISQDRMDYHPEIAMLLNAVREFMQNCHMDKSNQLSVLNKAMEMETSIYGPNSVASAITKTWIGTILISKGEVQNGNRILREAKAVYQNSPALLTTFYDIVDRNLSSLQVSGQQRSEIKLQLQEERRHRRNRDELFNTLRISQNPKLRKELLILPGSSFAKQKCIKRQKDLHQELKKTLKLLLISDDSKARREAFNDLENMGEYGVLKKTLYRNLTHSLAEIRYEAVDWLSQLGVSVTKEMVTALENNVKGEYWHTRKMAIEKLKELNQIDSLIQILQTNLASQKPEIRYEAVDWLIQLGVSINEQMITALQRNVNHRDSYVRRKAIGKLKDLDQIEPLIQILKTNLTSDEPEIRYEAVDWLILLGVSTNEQMIAALRRNVNHTDSKVREMAINKLKDLNEIITLIQALSVNLENADPEVSYDAVMCLGALKQHIEEETNQAIIQALIRNIKNVKALSNKIWEKSIIALSNLDEENILESTLLANLDSSNVVLREQSIEKLIKDGEISSSTLAEVLNKCHYNRKQQLLEKTLLENPDSSNELFREQLIRNLIQDDEISSSTLVRVLNRCNSKHKKRLLDKFIFKNIETTVNYYSKLLNNEDAQIRYNAIRELSELSLEVKQILTVSLEQNLILTLKSILYDVYNKEPKEIVQAIRMIESLSMENKLHNEINSALEYLQNTTIHSSRWRKRANGILKKWKTRMDLDTPVNDESNVACCSASSGYKTSDNKASNKMSSGGKFDLTTHLLVQEKAEIEARDGDVKLLTVQGGKAEIKGKMKSGKGNVSIATGHFSDEAQSNLTLGFFSSVQRKSSDATTSQDTQQAMPTQSFVSREHQGIHLNNVKITGNVELLNISEQQRVQIKSRAEIQCYNAPSPQKSWFVRRVTLMEEITTGFSKSTLSTSGEGSSQSSSCHRVVCGDEKTGKTALAMDYFFNSGKPYHFCAWFNAENPQKLKEQFLDLACVTGIWQTTCEKMKRKANQDNLSLNSEEQMEVIKAVVKWLINPENDCRLQVVLGKSDINVVHPGVVYLYRVNHLDWHYEFKTLKGKLETGKLDLNQLDNNKIYLEDAREKLNRDASAFSALKIDNRHLGEITNASAKQHILNLIGYFHYYSRDFCLVFDGAASNIALEDFLPSHGSDIIITSQNSLWFGYPKTIVSTLEKQEAIQLVKAILQDEEESMISNLVEKIGYKAAELESVANQIHGITTIERYLEEQEEQEEQEKQEKQTKETTTAATFN